MFRICQVFLLVLTVMFSTSALFATEKTGEIPPEEVSAVNQTSPEESLAMLESLAELQNNLKKQLALTREKIKTSTSDAENEKLKEELARLDQQLSDSSRDFERIATGVEEKSRALQLER